jgi:hypothetical protein
MGFEDLLSLIIIVIGEILHSNVFHVLSHLLSYLILTKDEIGKKEIFTQKNFTQNQLSDLSKV